MIRLRKLILTALLTLGMLGGLATVSEQAGATYVDGFSGLECGFTPPAPNAVDTCSKWVQSVFWHYPYSYKIDATHHYGWWGSSFDPGTWHVIVYLYYNGGLVGQVLNIDVGDSASPTVSVGNAPSFPAYIAFEGAWMGNFSIHRNCSASGIVKDVYYSDTANYDWAQGNSWPYGNDLYGGSCQQGFGSHGSSVKFSPATYYRTVSGVTTSTHPIELY